jgi:vitamin B12 transporter
VKTMNQDQPMSMRAIATVVILLGSPLAAQETTRDTARVTPVIVSATRVPLSQGSLPVAVTVITGDELRARGISTIPDALADVSSGYVGQSGSQGAQTSFFLRGGESKYVKVLIDGVPVNDPGGAYDFGSLTTDNIERIEIVRGPVSVLYGADAVTGVVNILTRRGQTSTAELDVRMGTMPRDRRLNANTGFGQGNSSTLDAIASARGAAGNNAYSLSFGRRLDEGLYETNNYYKSNVVSAAYDVRPAERTHVRLSGRYTDYKFDYPTNGGGDVTDLNAFRTEDKTALGVVIERQTARTDRIALLLNLSESDGATDDQADSTGGSTFISLERTRRRGAEVRGQTALRENVTLTLGLQLEQQDQRTQFQSDGPFGPFNGRFAASRRNYASYAELVASPTSTLTITLGLRADSNEQFGTFGTGRGGLSWRPTPSTRVRATAGTAFREPTFSENYSTGFVTGNPDLEPERTQSVDAGVDHELLDGRVQASLSAFAQRFRNMIDYDPGASACGFSYCNVAEATANGVELELRGRVVGPLSASTSATLLRTKVIEPGFDVSSGGLYREGESLIRRPERKITAEVAYRSRGPLSASLRALAVGVRNDRDFRPFPATPVVLPSYERFDLAAEYVVPMRQTKQTAVTLRIANLTNAYYENVFNFLAPRRTVTLGARSSF